MDVRRRSLLSETLHGGGSDEDSDYLTIKALEDGLTASLSINTCEYCVDGDFNWKTLSAGTTTEAINTGQTLSFRSELTPASSNGIGTFTINKKCNLKGNCMSMLFGDNAADNYSLRGNNYAFYKLFNGCKNIVNVSSNFLPATTLASSCYCYMFRNCTSLTTTPKLPATNLAMSCYYNMFSGCTNLTSAPELPATNLATKCYNSMFYNCTSLTTAPELPATILANSCYNSMFEKCTSLTTAPELPATVLTNSCYRYMFQYCSNLTTAPELPATILADYCYNSMFSGCTKLNYIKMLATNISASSCLTNWVGNVASTGTFVKNPAMTTLPIGSSGIPSGWTVVNDGEESGGGDDKVVNKITFKNLRGKKELTADVYCDYIPTSKVDIVFTGVSGIQNQTFVSPTKYEGGTIIGAKMESPFTVDWAPKEDDTYIYEVIIEQ